MLRIYLLGRLELEVDHATLEPPTGRPTRALLGWLALHPGTHQRSTVAGQLWPQVLDESARKSLRTALASLRAALGAEAANWLIATRTTVSLAGEPDVWVDARAFRALMAEERYEPALELCRGDLMVGLDDDWVLALRDEHREQQAEALAVLADAAQRAGDQHRAVGLARRRGMLDPFDEPAQRDLMQRLAAAGDRAGAVGAYERFAERLRRELALAPSGETRRLAAALRAGDPIGPRAPGRAGRPAPPGPAAPVLPARLATTRRPTPFVGRKRELDLLRELWKRAVRGERHVALLSGEPGIGKTRLAAELARELQAQGAAVLYGRAEEEPLLPYQPFVEALRDVVARDDVALAGETAELASLLPDLEGRRAANPATGEAAVILPRDAIAARVRFFDAVRSALEASTRRRPMLLILDDLHWADVPTLRLLGHIASGPSAGAALVVATYRDTELAHGHPLHAALADLARELPVEHVAVRPLAIDDAARLLEQATRRSPDRDVARALRAQTGGNPYFIEELLHGLDEQALGAFKRRDGGVPEGAAQVVRRRVSRLGPQAHALLTAGAVAGAEFELDLVAEVAGLPRDGALDVLDGAVRARLLDEVEPGRYGFVHALTRDALTAGLSAARAARLHELVAATLERRAAQDPDRYLGPLAHHALEAAAIGDLQWAVELARRAAEQATTVHAHEDAARLLERAIAVLARRGADPRRKADLLCALGETRQRTGASAAARAAFDGASEIARRLGEPELLARAALGAAGVGITILRIDRPLVDRLEEALGALDRDDDRLRPRLLARLAIELAYDRDQRRRDDLSREAVECARRLGDERALAAALGARHVALSAPDHVEERLRAAGEMLDLARRAGDRELALQARNWRVLDLFEVGDGPAVRSELDAYATLAAEAGLPVFSWYVPVWRATLALLEGRLDEALRLGRRAREQGRGAGDANADVYWQELRHARQMADERFDEDADLLRYIERKAAGSPAGRAYRATLAWTCAELGRHEDARRHLEAVAADDFSGVPYDMNRLPALASAAQATALLADVGCAGTLYRLLEPYRSLVSVSGRGSGHYGSVAFLLARLAATLGEVHAADHLYAEAAERDRRAGAPVWVARDLRHHGQFLLSQGDTARGREILLQAEEQARDTGLERVLEATRRALAAAG